MEEEKQGASNLWYPSIDYIIPLRDPKSRLGLF